jgi:general secretion pathway protein F
MSAMLTSRVDLMDALGLALRGVRISRRKEALEQATSDVRGGAPLSAALEKRGALMPTGYNLLRVGEQSGQLAQMLRVLATLYEEDSARRMKRLLTLIEPVAILLIGGFLGVIMIGIILAITSVNDIAF